LRSSGAGYLLPGFESLLANHAIGIGVHPVTARTKEIDDGAVGREETLGLARRFEAAHLPLLLPCRLMRNFRTVVEITMLAVCSTLGRISLRAVP
jgi:hypothetical protein